MIPDWLRDPLAYVGLFVGFAMMAYALHHYFHLPEVHVDPRGECVRVMDAGHIKTCARIPERHVRVVVAGRGR